MKKVLFTVAMLTALLATEASAQRYGYPQAPSPSYPPQSGYNQPYGQPNYNYDYDDYQFDRHLDWWDRELNLSRRQERDIRRVRDRFNQQTQSLNPRDPRQRDLLRQARQRQFYDMMAVLRPDQRDRVIARMRPYERYGDSRTANRGRGNNYGNRPGYDSRGY